jgi:regulatory protein
MARAAVSGGLSFLLPASCQTGLSSLLLQEFDEDSETACFLRESDEKARATMKAFELGARAEHSSLGLFNKLLARGFSRPSAQAAVQEAQVRGFVDDARYGAAYARSSAARRDYGPKRIALELRTRGLDGPTAQESLEGIDFLAALLRALSKERRRLPDGPREHLVHALLQRGFAFHDIEGVLEAGEGEMPES